jgi:hypothetical protein
VPMHSEGLLRSRPGAMRKACSNSRMWQWIDHELYVLCSLLAFLLLCCGVCCMSIYLIRLYLLSWLSTSDLILELRFAQELVGNASQTERVRAIATTQLLFGTLFHTVTGQNAGNICSRQYNTSPWCNTAHFAQRPFQLLFRGMGLCRCVKDQRPNSLAKMRTRTYLPFGVVPYQCSRHSWHLGMCYGHC